MYKKAKFIALSALLMMSSLLTPIAHSQTRVGEIVDAAIKSPHPYPNGTSSIEPVWRHVLHHPGATFIKIHVAQLALDGTINGDIPQGDYVLVKDSDGREHEVLSGIHKGDIWVRSVPGDTAVIELHADDQGNAFGLVIDRYGYGTEALFPDIEAPPPESICGFDDRTGICQAQEQERIRLSDPVARLMFVNDCGGIYMCSGFLFAADGRLMTNAHCANSQSESESMEVWFNHIDDNTTAGACSLADRPVPDVYESKTFLQKHCDLDFAVHLIEDPTKGNPADVYGYLNLSDRLPQLGEPVWLPQHPRGFDKRIAEVDAAVANVSLQGIDFCADPPAGCFSNGSDTGKLTEFGYTADTEGGSSGSPVLDENNLVIGLHHAGGCEFSGGENAGVLMNEIMAALSDTVPSGESSLTVKRLSLMFSSGKLSLNAVLELGEDVVVDPAAEPFLLVLSDSDGEIIDLTIPPGSFEPNSRAIRWTYRDSDGTLGGLTKVILISRKNGREIKVSATGRNMDLAGADQTAINIDLTLGDDVFAVQNLPCDQKTNNAVCK